MKNSKKPRYSALYRFFSAISALAIVSLAGYLISYGAIIYAFAVLLMGFLIRNFVLLCARQDEDIERMQKQDDFIKRDQFFY